jgi:hypothetical protein
MARWSFACWNQQPFSRQPILCARCLQSGRAEPVVIAPIAKESFRNPLLSAASRHTAHAHYH